MRHHTDPKNMPVLTELAMSLVAFDSKRGFQFLTYLVHYLNMRRWLRLVLLMGLGLPMATLGATGQTQARLVLYDQVTRPGGTFLAGVHLRMPRGWHTYWRNSGDSGAPTTVEWALPPGITAGELLWPVPEKLIEGPLATYVYHEEVVLLAPLTVSSTAPKGAQRIKAKVRWIECAKTCVPGEAEIESVFRVEDVSKPSEEARLIDSWKARLPMRSTVGEIRAGWGMSTASDEQPLIIEWLTTGTVSEADFFPYASESYAVAPQTERLADADGRVRLCKNVKRYGPLWPHRIEGLIVARSDPGAPVTAYEVRLDLPPAGPQGGPLSEAATASGNTSRVLDEPLWLMLCYAFMGGLILNLMPCVLPVLALKVLAFVNQSRESPARARRLGLIYGLGVVVSFLVLAGMVIGVKATGHRAGWGMQFGNPVFVVALTTLITIVALNLFGLFEVTVSGKVLGHASQLATKTGTVGAFFNGVLATLLATPCTAPFLAVALGFAFVQSDVVILLIFLTVAVGLAAPYVILSSQPAWLKFLPRPGPWMERFKVAMGFPMLATAVWLLQVTTAFYGKRVLWLGLFLVLLALVAWVFGEFVQRGRKRRGLALVVCLLLLVFGYAYGLEGQLRWRSPIEAAASRSLKQSADGIDWQPWSAAAVAQARAQGRPVFVDFTADWCLTCQANKMTSIEIPRVRAKLKTIDAVALLGDYTRFSSDITAELKRHGRAGVPLVLVYPKDATAPPIVLPEVLTPQIVLEALSKAGS
jgi:thiol:disulfide interchange protein DsbD